MSDTTTRWDELKRLGDELELKLHLAGMEARERWVGLRPRLEALEKNIAKSGKRAVDAIEHELSSLGAALRELRDDIVRRLEQTTPDP